MSISSRGQWKRRERSDAPPRLENPRPEAAPVYVTARDLTPTIVSDREEISKRTHLDAVRRPADQTVETRARVCTNDREVCG
jgi:hypothetical protein